MHIKKYFKRTAKSLISKQDRWSVYEKIILQIIQFIKTKPENINAE